MTSPVSPYNPYSNYDPSTDYKTIADNAAATTDGPADDFGIGSQLAKLQDQLVGSGGGMSADVQSVIDESMKVMASGGDAYAAAFMLAMVLISMDAEDQQSDQKAAVAGAHAALATATAAASDIRSAAIAQATAEIIGGAIDIGMSGLALGGTLYGFHATARMENLNRASVTQDLAKSLHTDAETNETAAKNTLDKLLAQKCAATSEGGTASAAAKDEASVSNTETLAPPTNKTTSDSADYQDAIALQKGIEDASTNTSVQTLENGSAKSTVETEDQSQAGSTGPSEEEASSVSSATTADLDSQIEAAQQNLTKATTAKQQARVVLDDANNNLLKNYKNAPAVLDSNKEIVTKSFGTSVTKLPADKDEAAAQLQTAMSKVVKDATDTKVFRLSREYAKYVYGEGAKDLAYMGQAALTLGTAIGQLESANQNEGAADQKAVSDELNTMSTEEVKTYGAALDNLKTAVDTFTNLINLQYQAEVAPAQHL